MIVRAAVASDAAAVARVHARSWRVAYRGLVPDAYLDGLSDDTWRERWERGLATAGDRHGHLGAARRRPGRWRAGGVRPRRPDARRRPGAPGAVGALRHLPRPERLGPRRGLAAAGRDAGLGAGRRARHCSVGAGRQRPGTPVLRASRVRRGRQREDDRPRRRRAGRGSLPAAARRVRRVRSAAAGSTRSRRPSAARTPRAAAPSRPTAGPRTGWPAGTRPAAGSPPR